MSKEGANRIEKEIRELIRVRDPEQEPRNRLPHLPLVQAWQQQRLARSFKDLLDSPRHQQAAQFFLDELYGDFDLHSRDQDLARMAPTLKRFLPAHAQAALADAIELDALSHRMDLELSAQLPESLRVLDVPAYTHAYRASDRAGERERQLDLIGAVGRQLDGLVHQFWLTPVIRMAKVPAEMLGIGSLHRFLVRGLESFRAMGGADEFLHRIDRGERAVRQALLAGTENPFGFDLNYELKTTKPEVK